MSDEMKVVHNGVEVVYVERENKWRFTLRGRERSAESLAKAKESIDKPAPKEKSTLEKVGAFYETYEGIVSCTVTSIAERDRWSSIDKLWIMVGKERKKVNGDSVYVDTDRNRELVRKINKNDITIDKLHKENRDIKTVMDRIVIPKSEEVEA